MFTGQKCSFSIPHLVFPEVVNCKHAGQVQHNAETLEGGDGEPQSPILLHQAGGIVLAVGASLLTRQAFVGCV